MIYKKVVAGFIAITVCLSIGVSSSFGMIPRKYGPPIYFSKALNPEICKIEPMQPRIIEHTKVTQKTETFTHFYSWVDLGMKAAGSLSGSVIGGKVAVMVSNKLVGRLIGVGASYLSKKIIEKTENTMIDTAAYNNKKGIKVTVKYKYDNKEDCKCTISKDHGDKIFFKIESINIEIV